MLGLVTAALAVVATSGISMEVEPVLPQAALEEPTEFAAPDPNAHCVGFSNETLKPDSWPLQMPGVTGHCIYEGKRCWLQYVPPAAKGTLLPLLVSLHGGGSCAEFRLAYDNATKQGWVVVWPQAAGMPWPRMGLDSMSCWNGDGVCCGPQAINNAVDDVGFVRQVIMNVIDGLSDPSLNVIIDTTRIYMTGHSMGCMLSQRFLTKHSDLIAAMSCTSMVIGRNPIPAFFHVSATPVLIIQGFVDKDTYVNGRSGKNNTPNDVNGIPWGAGYPWEQISSLSSIKKISGMMGCAGEVSKGNSSGELDSSLWAPNTISTYVFEGTECNKMKGKDVTVSLLLLPKCGHEAYKDQGEEPKCNFDTLSTQYDFLRDWAGAAPKLDAAVKEWTQQPKLPEQPSEGGISGLWIVIILLVLGGLGVLISKYFLAQNKREGTESHESEMMAS